jgi:Flp pilus assembly protein TadG
MIVALFALMLITLLGMVGLVIDGGMLMADHRHVQNAADAGAQAAAMELYLGNSKDAATTAATTFVQNYNGLSNATVTVNFGSDISSMAAPQHKTDRYVEVIVTYSWRTYFIHLLGFGTKQAVQARAVAGYEAVSSGEGAIVLDPTARPGMSVSGGASLVVDGAVVVNSRSAGLDQYGNDVDWGYQKYGSTTSNNSTLQARLIQIRGGVDTVSNYTNYDPSGPSPLFARGPIVSDPLRDTPSPQQSNVSSISNWTRQAAVKVSTGQTVTLNPGVYEDIQIGGGTVTFNPGVYILSPTKNNQGFGVTGSPTIKGDGVMFYLTGSDYLDTSPGYWDAQDDSQNAQVDGPLPPTNGSDTLPAAPDPSFNKVSMASLNFNATNATVTLNGLKDSTSVFNNVLFFQRRRNTTAASIQGNAGVNVNLKGTMYAKWANFKVSGGGKYNAQFVVGSMAISGTADVTILKNGNSLGRANQVFLVE